MLQEMKLEDALKRFLRGKKVLVLYNETTATDKPAYAVEVLSEMLDGMHFLVDVPAVEDSDFKQAVEQMTKPEKAPPQTPKKKLADPPKNKSKLDEYENEIIQMLKDGKSQYAIANKLGATQSTVAHWMTRHGIDKSGNRKKCSTCQYRETSPGKGNCDYIGKTGHRRNCNVEECDKYVKGDPLPGLKGGS